MIADSVEFLAGHGRRVLVDAEHFFDGYKAQPRVLACGRSRPPSSRAPATSCCATPTAARCPTRSPRSSPPCARHFGDDVMVGIHCHDDTGCAVANSMAAVLGRGRPRAGHAQRARRAHRQRQPDDDHPQPAAQARLHVPARRAPRAADGRQPPRRRAAQPGRQPAGAVRRLVGVRAQGRVAHQRHRPRQGRLRARRPGARRQRHPLRRQRDGRAGDDHDEGRGARARDGRPGRQHGDRRPQAPRARGLPLRGRRRLARAADAPGDRLGAGLLPRREHARHHRRAAGPATSRPRPRSRCGSATSAMCRRPRATDRSTPSTRRCARRSPTPYPQLARVHLTDFKVRILDGAGATGAVTRVLLDATDGERDWTTIGVSANIIEASWRALEESLVYGLLHAAEPAAAGTLTPRPALPVAGARRIAVRVTPDALRQVRAGHPWVFDASVTSVGHDGAPGDLAVVFDDHRRFAAIGLYDPTSPIRVRVLHHGDPVADRRRLVPRPDRCRVRAARPGHQRWAHERVPARPRRERRAARAWSSTVYDTTAVVKAYTAAWLPHVRAVVGWPPAAAARTRRPAARARRRRVDAAAFDGVALVGELPGAPVPFREAGLSFEADVVRGPEDRALPRPAGQPDPGRPRLAGGAACSTCSPAPVASPSTPRPAGRRAVLSVDQSAPALAMARRNMALNRDGRAGDAPRRRGRRRVRGDGGPGRRRPPLRRRRRRSAVVRQPPRPGRRRPRCATPASPRSPWRSSSAGWRARPGVVLEPGHRRRLPRRPSSGRRGPPAARCGSPPGPATRPTTRSASPRVRT